MSTLGQRIAQSRRAKSYRDARDVTMREIAAAVGVSATSVSEWESDKVIPREDALAKLARFLDVTPAWLRYGVEGTKQPAGKGGLEDLRAGGVALTPAQIARAEEKASRDRAAQRTAAQSVRPTRRRKNGGTTEA